MNENKGIWSALTNDGTILLGLSGLMLVFFGSFALFLSFSGDFLPHDAAAIGFTADQLYLISENLVKFMLHDRAAFGGVLLSIGTLYVWLAFYPLANGQAGAWKTFCISGLCGFGSFLLYLGYGYLDKWHAVATVFLLTIYLYGLWKSRKLIQKSQPLYFLPDIEDISLKNTKKLASLLYHIYAVGLITAGFIISCIGVTTIFVPSDLQFIELCSDDIGAISSQLLGVIAHDRAGFGGALFTTGITVWLILLNARFSKSLWETLLISGTFGFIPTIGIHFYVGYTDFLHILPAFIGAGIFYTAIIYSSRSGKG